MGIGNFGAEPVTQVERAGLREVIAKSMIEAGWIGTGDFVSTCSERELLGLVEYFVRLAARVQ